VKEEGPRALYKGIVPGLVLVSNYPDLSLVTFVRKTTTRSTVLEL